ncbi:hypothetical protein HMN09_00561200 [Mycena chlorophos]|uniref:Uncharacterized protein n=1 Tax=Mycena chlorophos TaxID=658473 RepID=A0A8H6WDP0_MYCCL|nr:hypothetical protein HMN09_00561200 [Mycena chlorophos]
MVKERHNREVRAKCRLLYAAGQTNIHALCEEFGGCDNTMRRVLSNDYVHNELRDDVQEDAGLVARDLQFQRMLQKVTQRKNKSTERGVIPATLLVLVNKEFMNSQAAGPGEADTSKQPSPESEESVVLLHQSVNELPTKHERAAVQPKPNTEKPKPLPLPLAAGPDTSQSNSENLRQFLQVHALMHLYDPLLKFGLDDAVLDRLAQLTDDARPGRKDIVEEMVVQIPEMTRFDAVVFALGIKHINDADAGL